MNNTSVFLERSVFLQSVVETLLQNSGHYSLLALDKLDLKDVAELWHGAFYEGRPLQDHRESGSYVNEDARDGIVEFLWAYFASDRGRIILSEERFENDRPLTQWELSPRAYVEGERFCFLSANGATREAVSELAWELSGRWTVGVCLATNGCPPSTANELREAVSKADYIFTTALDGEGFVIWSQTELVL